MIKRAASRFRAVRPGNAAPIADMAAMRFAVRRRPVPAAFSNAAPRPRLRIIAALVVFFVLCLAQAGPAVRGSQAASKAGPPRAAAGPAKGAPASPAPASVPAAPEAAAPSAAPAAAPPSPPAPEAVPPGLQPASAETAAPPDAPAPAPGAVPAAEGDAAQVQEQLPAVLETALYRLPKGDPSGPLLAVLTLVSAPGWHAYAVGPAESGQSARAALTAGANAAAALFPPGAPTPDPMEPDKTVLVYEGRTPIFVPLSAEAAAAPLLAGELRVFSCSETSCWPSSLPVALALAGADPAALPPAEGQSWWPLYLALRNASLASPLTACPDPGLTASLHPTPPTAAPAAAAAAAPETPKLSPRSFTPALEVGGLLKAALLAFAAGFVLNFMPCVLPVVSLKLSGLLAISGEEGRQERRRILREHNFFFALGIVTYFLCLSLILGAFGLAWGEMFQSPSLAIVAAVALFALSLSLFGVFHLPVVDLKITSGGRGHTRRGAFLTGALATLLATPCSGPFLGGVLAWTLLQPQHVIMTVFTAIGLGMASPYGVLAIWPRLVRLLPRPGAWMQGLERVMAFLLAGTCLYFLALLPPARILPTLGAFWASAIGATLLGRMHQAQSAFRGLVMGVAALAVAGGGLAFALAYAPQAEAEWVAYTPETFAARLSKDNLVLDFTADWCPTCKLLERTVLTPPRVAQWGKRHKAVFMKVDLTRQTPPAMALLRALGSQSIPVAAFFPAGDEASRPLVLRDLFTAGQFEQAMDEAFGPPHARPATGGGE